MNVTIAELQTLLRLSGWRLYAGRMAGGTWAEIHRGEEVLGVECDGDLTEAVSAILLIVARDQPEARRALGTN